MNHVPAQKQISAGALALVASALVAPAAAQVPAAPQAGPAIWRKASLPPEVLAARPWIRPTAGQPLELDEARLQILLAAAPREGAFPVRESTAVIELPRPDGTLERFAFVESPVMQPALQARFPGLRAYLGQGLDNPAATVRFDVSLLGFRAQVLEPRAGGPDRAAAWYIDPVSGGDTRHYVSYFHGMLAPAGATECSTPQAAPALDGAPRGPSSPASPAAADGAPLEVLRNEFGIAVSTTGEFSVGLAAQMNPPQSPSVALTMSVIQSTLNRVNQVLERDGPVRLLLVANNDRIVYTDPATDPYDTTQADASLQQQFQDNINAVLGTTSYSFGHTFHWQAAGYRGNAGAIGTVCNDSKKALGFSSTSSATGDYFMIDLVAHEIGHQLGATHTFNGMAGSCASVGGVPQWTADTAYEPGSGSTIMSYGGSCGSDDIVSAPTTPDPPTANGAKVPMYNLSSMIQIANFVTGTTCVARIPTGNLHTGATPPVQGPYVIPSDTPFRLISPSAEYGGPNDSLTYSIEQFDRGPQLPLGQDRGQGEPLFRVLAPSVQAERRFPSFEHVLDGTPSLGENLPRYSRTSAFRGVLRDNVAGAGGWGWGDIDVEVVEVPLPGFRVTAPPALGAYCAGQGMGVTWNVATTNEAPINAATVDILMSADGGQSFPWTLAADFPNSGAALVPVPAVPTTAARVLVQSSGGLFFHVNAGPFETATGPPTIAVQPVGSAICPFQTLNLSYTPGPGAPRHNQWYRNGVPIPGATGETYSVEYANHADSGDYKVVVSNGCGSVTSVTVHIQVGVTFDPAPAPNPEACHDLVLPSAARGVGNMTFQWSKNGQPLAGDSRITGVNGPTLTIGRARYEDEGSYQCRVQDQCETRFMNPVAVALPTPAWALRATSGPIKRGVATADLAYDAFRRVSVLYGGAHPDGQALGDTWEWDGVGWAQRFPPHGPGPRTQHEMTYDTVRHAVLLFSGYANPPMPFNNSEVWSYDGNDWTLVTTSPDGPPANVALHGQTTFDSARGKMVLVYGLGGSTPTDETWEFDSPTATWSLASSGPGPEYNNSPVAFDDSRGVAVGQYYWPTDNPIDAKTWTSAGTGWSPVATPTPARYYPALAYDAMRHRVTMYACCRNQGPGAYRTDTHAFDGSQWADVLPDVTLSQQDAVIPLGMAFDSVRRAMVMVGSAYNDAYYAAEQTWEYRYRDRVMLDRQPRDASAPPGGTAQLSVVADGAPALTYRWRRGTTILADGPTPSGSVISGATTPWLTIWPVSAADAGTYQVAVANACGEELSTAAALVVAGTGSGRVPGDRGSAGNPVRVSRAVSGVALTWGPSCNGADTDYEVYEGAIGAFAGHEPRLCTTGGARSATFAPAAGNRYFLVVPRDATQEGSYGLDSRGVERPPSAAACVAQSIAACP
ncbi:MAG: hypothetical protein KBD01_17160 [Acidobacteria bacterium]|nr:hypothetical protein [Acidobacteriota bacterium]